jgi:outer membrane protein assembly factor BamA
MERIDEKEMRYMSRILGMVLLLSGLFSCRIAKKLPADELIYGGAVLHTSKSDSLKNTDKADLEAQMLEISRPIENTSLKFPFVGNFPYKVGFYYAFDSPRNKGIKAKIKNRLGEKPVFISQRVVDKNADNLKEFLRTKGFFQAKITGSLKKTGFFASAQYEVDFGPRYRLDSLTIKAGNEEFDQDFLKFGKQVSLKKDQFFDLQQLKAARLHIESGLRQQGYYFFRPDYVAIWADSSQQPLRVNLRLGPKPDMPPLAKRQYLINDIFVSINADKPPASDTLTMSFFNGLILNDEKNAYKERIFKDAIAFRPGALYNSQLQDITNNRLLGLSNFKFIKSNFEVVNRLDSTLLNVHYFLQTQKKKSFRAEANAITRSSGLAGSQVSVSWQNINIFRGAEFFKLSALSSFEVQVGGSKSSQYRGNYRVGFESQLSIPRFLAPFIRIDPEASKVLPKTQINVGYESFIKTGLYNLNSARTSLQYAWTRGRGVDHVLKPLSLNFVKASNISTVFIGEIFSDPRLLGILENQFVAGGAYEITMSPKIYKKSSFSYRGNFDFAGNVFGWINQIKNKGAKKGKLFGEDYAQFLRFEQDFRYRNDLNPKLQWANRAIVGVGVPYGNSLQLPFVNQFYVGGNNSLRAFRARGVGPGTYARTGNLAEQFLGNNTGDVKLEFNTEMRLKVNGFFSTALFFDAGNVWMLKDEYIYGSGSLFTKKFYKDFAMGSGVGFRFNLSFIIFRIDVATPLRKPWLESGRQWVIDEINLGQKTWRKDNLIWNLAVGLPF